MKDDTEAVEGKIAELSDLIVKEPQRALALLLPLAKAGYSAAQFNAGFIMATSSHRQPPGQNFDEWLDAVTKSQWQEWDREDEPQAYYWYVQAAEQGHPEAVLQARLLAERLQLDALPWKEATGKRRELLDLAEQHGYFMIGFLRAEELNGLPPREYLERYMSKP